jgi:hypothetical protein
MAIVRDARELAVERRRSLFVRVARDNHSPAFYEALGGRLVCEGQTEILGQVIDEVGYGWSAIQDLLGRLRKQGE